MGRVVGIDLVFLEKLVGEVGASLKSKLLGQAESVVAVKQEVLDLVRRQQK